MYHSFFFINCPILANDQYKNSNNETILDINVQEHVLQKFIHFSSTGSFVIKACWKIRSTGPRLPEHFGNWNLQALWLDINIHVPVGMLMHSWTSRDFSDVKIFGANFPGQQLSHDTCQAGTEPSHPLLKKCSSYYQTFVCDTKGVFITDYEIYMYINKTRKLWIILMINRLWD